MLLSAAHMAPHSNSQQCGAYVILVLVEVILVQVEVILVVQVEVILVQIVLVILAVFNLSAQWAV